MYFPIPTIHCRKLKLNSILLPYLTSFTEYIILSCFFFVSVNPFSIFSVKPWITQLISKIFHKLVYSLWYECNHPAGHEGRQGQLGQFLPIATVYTVWSSLLATSVLVCWKPWVKYFLTPNINDALFTSTTMCPQSHLTPRWSWWSRCSRWSTPRGARKPKLW